MNSGNRLIKGELRMIVCKERETPVLTELGNLIEKGPVCFQRQVFFTKDEGRRKR